MKQSFENKMKIIAAAAFENAEQLCHEAKLLNQECCFARALSLAIIGQEEFGKSILCTCLTLGLFRDVKCEILRGGFRNHNTKLIVAQFADTANGIVMEWVQDCISTVGFFGKLSPAERFVEFFKILKEDSSLKEISVKKFHNEKAFGIYSDKLAKMDELKQRGLYVDMDNSEFLVPSQIDPNDTENYIEDLECVLGDFRWLKDHLGDEPGWTKAREEFR